LDIDVKISLIFSYDDVCIAFYLFNRDNAVFQLVNWLGRKIFCKARKPGINPSHLIPNIKRMEGLSQLPSWMSVVFPILLTGQSDHTQSTVVLKLNTSQVGIKLYMYNKY
jgi:hypothetical protein